MRNHAIFAAIAAIVLVAAPFFLSDGPLFILSGVLVEVIFALSWNLMFGFAGITSFGHAMFFAIGAYGTGYALSIGLPIPFPVLLAAMFVIGGLAAGLVGLAALKRSAGTAFAIATLAIAEILRLAIGQSDALGREDGLAAIPRPTVGPFVLSTTESYYWFLVIVSVLCIGALYWLCQGQFGRTLNAMRQDAMRTEFVGVDIGSYRLMVFSIAGAFAAVAGALHAPLVQIVTPEIGGYLHSAQPMLSSLLGGVNSFWGPVVGVGMFSAIEYSTRTLPGTSEFVTGIVLLTLILLAPSGILGLFRGLFRPRSERVLPVAGKQEAK